MSYRSFRKMIQGVLINGEVKRLNLGAVGKPIARNRKVRGRVCSPGVIGGIPEARRTMRGQVEAS